MSSPVRGGRCREIMLDNSDLWIDWVNSLSVKNIRQPFDVA